MTIMLNSITPALPASRTCYKQKWFRQSGSAKPQSHIVDHSAALFPLFPDPFRLNAGFLVAVVATVFVWWLLERSTLGSEFRAVGENPNAARTAGISVGRVTVVAMMIAGALAGLAGAAQVLGTEQKLTMGIGGSLGFDAITVALLGRSRPVGTFLAGLLSARSRPAATPCRRRRAHQIDIILVVQSVIVLLIAAPPLVRAIFRLPAPVGKGAR